MVEKSIYSKIKKNGFFIYDNFVDLVSFNKIKNFWQKKSREVKLAKEKYLTVINNFGASNHNVWGNHDDSSFYRNIEYFWNPPVDELTRKVMLKIHKYRNLITADDENLGLLINPQMNYFYQATLIYPNGTGYFSDHRDVENGILVHAYLPLTIAGTDYEEGGVYIRNHENKIIHLDALAKPGSAVFYNGGLIHGVNKTKSNNNVDRIAIYALFGKFLKTNDMSFLTKLFFKADLKLQGIFRKNNRGPLIRDN